jgi:hypothetical protein
VIHGARLRFFAKLAEHWAAAQLLRQLAVGTIVCSDAD